MIGSLIGYLASLLLALSLMVNNDLKFRWLNTAGCFTFIIYGIVINAFPVTLTNVLLFCINVYYLTKIYRTKEDFDFVEFSTKNQLIKKFMRFYNDDLKSYFPSFNPQTPNDISLMVLRNMAIANVFVANLDENGNAVVQINYTVPKFRDYQVGRFIFEKGKQVLAAKGVKKVIYEQVENKSHLAFLKTMGFEESIHDGKTKMVKTIQ